jgi:F-type H+-transporting ATPase subunit gamma
VHDVSYAGRKSIGFADADDIGHRVAEMLAKHEVDVVTVVYNQFHSVISQVVTEQQLIPLPMPADENVEQDTGPRAIYEFEPDEETILARLLPQNLSVQIYHALLESAAGEHGARMTAMDNATRNAGDMIKRLTLNYNRARQANITRELIEIISGAEAV